jgi:uncharacterized protein (DUF58 family)
MSESQGRSAGSHPGHTPTERRKAITIRRRIVLVLLAACLLAAFQTGSSIFYGVAYLWAGLLAVSWLWVRIGLRGLVLRRELRSPESRVGLILEERFALENHSRWPHFWVELWDESTLPDHRASTVITGLGGGRARQWVVRTLCRRRGRFRLGPLTARVVDPFGIFQAEARFTKTSELLVQPYVVNLPVVHLGPSQLPGGASVQRKTSALTPSAAGVRDYAPGDSLSRIHWPSTARRGHLISKEFELDPKSEVWIYLDEHREVHCSLPEQEEPEDKGAPFWLRPRLFRLPSATEEYGIAAAASLAQYFLRHDRSVGLLTYGPEREAIQPDRGERQRMRIMQVLSAVQAESALAAGDVIRLEANGFSRGAAVVLISPSGDPKISLAAQILRSRGLEISVILIERSTFGATDDVQGLARRLQGLRIGVRILRRNQDLAVGLMGQALPRFLPVP